MFYPIYISNSIGGCGTEYIYPSWVMFIAGSGITISLIGMIAFFICTILMIISDDNRFDITEKPASYVFVPILVGLILILIALPLLVLTGKPVIE